MKISLKREKDMFEEYEARYKFQDTDGFYKRASLIFYSTSKNAHKRIEQYLINKLKITKQNIIGSYYQ